MCDIQYKGQLSKEQVRELVKKYPLEDPATQEDLQHLADALDRNGTCPLARAINALTDKASDGKLYKPGRNDLMRLYDELALHKHLRLKVDDTTKLIYFICPPQGREQPLTAAKHVHSDNTHLDRFCTAMRTHPRTNSLPHAENTSTTILVAWARGETTGASQLCALLGDVGAGKTTTSILLTRKLLELRHAGEDVPLPIFFDLRNLSMSNALSDGIDVSLQTILARLLASSTESAISVEQFKDAVRTERTLIIIDSLDEVLVHLEPGDGHRLIRSLLDILTLTAPPPGM